MSNINTPRATGIEQILRISDSFWSRVARPHKDSCWLWLGYIEKRSGYGTIRVGDKKLYAHALSWKLTNGSNQGLCVLHKCDIRPCCNPAHLFLGTKAENSADMVKKGRSLKGERNTRAKLTATQVQKIRTLLQEGVPQKSLATRYKVDYNTINSIKLGHIWR